MTIKKMFFIAISLCSLITLTGIVYKTQALPDFVQASLGDVSNKMSNSYGSTQCLALKGKSDQWYLECTPENIDKTLEFIVYPSDQPLYKGDAPYHLLPNNKYAKSGVGMYFDEGLMGYLNIDDGVAL